VTPPNQARSESRDDLSVSCRDACGAESLTHDLGMATSIRRIIPAIAMLLHIHLQHIL
jgi:hypothetical protein